jgi:hypothetical protein
MRAHSRETLAAGTGLLLLLLCRATWADDVSGASSMLCYGWTAARCDTENGCTSTEPWRLDLPDFVSIDMSAKVIKTTGAAAAARSTSVRTLERADGMILLQGNEKDRAFSWLIKESTGEGTLTVSTPGEALSVFTLCTPSPPR